MSTLNEKEWLIINEIVGEIYKKNISTASPKLFYYW